MGLKLARSKGEAILLMTSDGPVLVTLLSARGSSRNKEKCELAIDAPITVRILYKQSDVAKMTPHFNTLTTERPRPIESS